MQMTLIHSNAHLKVVHNSRQKANNHELQVVYRKNETPVIYLTTV